VDFGSEMVVDVSVPPFHLKEPVAGGEFDAGFGFLLAEFAEDRAFQKAGDVGSAVTLVWGVGPRREC